LLILGTHAMRDIAVPLAQLEVSAPHQWAATHTLPHKQAY
jgi:hypothetical protein